VIKNNKNSQPMTETLEARTMFAAHPMVAAAPVALDVTTNGSDLVINGTAKNDAITVTKTDAGLLIGNTGGWTKLVTGNFHAIRVNGNLGNDTVTVDASVTTNTIIHGNAGNDSLFGGSGNDQLFADAGVDTLVGNAGDDTFVTIGGGKDKLTGGTGNDSYWMNTTTTISDLAGNENGNVHKVASFASVKTTTVVGKKTKTVTTAIPTTLNGQNLIDPASTGTVYRNFAGRQLFADNGPIENDIQQGYLGDCYFLATLSSVAKVNPNAIKQSIVDLGDGTYAVQFTKGNTQTFIRIDADLPTWSNGALAYANAGSQGSLWVALMEKAFAQFRTGANSYASIEGGWMTEVATALGKNSTTTYNKTDLVSVIKSALEAGKSVTYGANTPTDGAPLIGSHAYTVDRVNTDGTVTLRNPWAVDGIGHDNANDGYVTVTAAQLKNAMIGLVITNV